MQFVFFWDLGTGNFHTNAISKSQIQVSGSGGSRNFPYPKALKFPNPRAWKFPNPCLRSFRIRGTASFRIRRPGSFRIRGLRSFRIQGAGSFRIRGPRSFRIRGPWSFRIRGPGSFESVGFEVSESGGAGSFRIRGAGSFRIRGPGSFRIRGPGSFRIRGLRSFRIRGAASFRIRRPGSFLIRGPWSFRIRGPASFRIRGLRSFRIRGAGSFRIRGPGSFRIRRWSFRIRGGGSFRIRGPGSFRIRRWSFRIRSWPQCKHRSGPQHSCPDLSIDLSSVLRLLVFGLDLIWWTNRWHPWISLLRMSNPLHAFHQLHQHRFHRLFHIPFHHEWRLHHAHLQWSALPLKPLLQALQPSLPLNLVMEGPLCNHHQEDTPTLKRHEPMALISIHNGKKTKTIMTTRRSTAWLFQEPFGNRHTAKSWTSRDATHCNFQWQLCCFNRPTTSGWGNWPMDVNCSWSRRGTLPRWFSLLNSSPNFGTKGWISTESARQKPGRMESCWTRPKTPSTQHSKWQTLSTVGFLPDQPILTHNRNWPNCAANWPSFASNLEKNRTLPIPQDLQPPVLRPILSKLHSWEALEIHLHPIHRPSIHPHCW